MLKFNEKENVKMVNKKMVAKLTTLVLALCLVLGMIPANAAYNKTFDVWDGSVTENWFAKTNADYNKDTNYRGKTLYIDSAADFMAFRNAVWEGTNYQAWGGGPYTSFWQCTVELRCDIDLNNINLQYGAGGTNSYNSFNGTFNGNGHVIKNIKINPNVADGAKVQPGANVQDGSLAADNKSYLGLFGYFKGDNDAASLNAGRVMNLHLENVEITLPDDDVKYCAGAFIGYGLNDVNIASCSAKNVVFKRNVATSTQPRSYIGGIAGFLEGKETYVRNTYAKDVDFSQLPGGVYMTNLYASGMMNVSNLNFLNIYTKGVKENNAEFVTGSTPTSGIYYFDSLIYPVSGTFTAGYSNGRAYAEVPKRIVNKAVSTSVKLGEQPVNVYSPASSTFAGGGTKSDRSYPYYMMPVGEGGYTLDYAPTASERLVMGCHAKLFAGDAEVKAMPATATEVTAQVEIMNSTREEQTVDVVIAGYKNGKLVRTAAETLTAEVAVVSLNNGAKSDALGAVCLLPSVDTGWAKVVTTKSISTEGLDTIKVFCWNALGDLYAISPSLEITNN